MALFMDPRCVSKLHLSYHCISIVLQVTWVDIGIYLLLDNLSEYFEFKISADEYPCLVKLHTSVAHLPNIKKWIETRPKTVY